MSQESVDYSLLLREMLGKFIGWIDEISLREHGYRFSELQSLTANIVRYTVIMQERPSDEVKQELDQMLETYKIQYLPRLRKMEAAYLHPLRPERKV